jgi:pimeloyl-ACP methyl ester carboxylesterase
LGVSAEAVAPAVPYVRVMHTDANLDAELEAAQTALLARCAPGTRARRVRWSQGETQVLELGAGPPVLLLHGFLDNAFLWGPILPALARNRRVLAVDFPGHGLADAFDFTGVDLLDLAQTFLRDIFDTLELPAAALVGCSLGGLSSAAFTLAAPERVSRLVLVGAPPGVTRRVPFPLLLIGYLSAIGKPLARLVMSKPTREGTRKFMGMMAVVHPERLDDALLDADVASGRRNIESHLNLLGCLGNVRGLRRELILGDRWLELGVPTMFLCGDRDRFMGRREEKAWAAIGAQNPNIRIVRVPDAGHLLWLDDPERVVDETEGFLATSSDSVTLRARAVTRKETAA